MVFSDQTGLFRELLAERQPSYPPGRPHSPSASGSKDKGKSKQVEEDAEFLKEAYRIWFPAEAVSFTEAGQYSHIDSLSTLLHSIRKPYLSLAAPPPSSRRPRPAEQNGPNGDDEDGMRRWEGSKYLTDRERDEIDLRGKMILRRSRERVRVLEEGEKERQMTVLPPPSALYSFLPSLAPSPSQSSEPLIAAHRSSVIWTLNNRLASTSSLLTSLQERRSALRAERDRSLGSQAAREVAILRSLPAGTPTSLGPSAPVTQVIPTDEPPIESQLSKEQLQAFESENSALLNHMEEQLNSVLAAEKSLLEVSALQTELVRHLVQQTELTERLYEEAVGSVAEVKAGNEQLKEARKRGQDGRLFLLIFLLGAAMALLFLDWYA